MTSSESGADDDGVGRSCAIVTALIVVSFVSEYVCRTYGAPDFLADLGSYPHGWG